MTLFGPNKLTSTYLARCASILGNAVFGVYEIQPFLLENLYKLVLYQKGYHHKQSSLVTMLNIEFFPGSSLGDCVTDSFSITSPGSEGTPIICGFNSGQHSKSASFFKNKSVKRKS